MLTIYAVGSLGWEAVTHDRIEAMTMGSRMAVMSAGLLQHVGAPQELYDDPMNKFVAGFIGSPAMNFLELQIGRGADGPVLSGPDVSLPVPERLRGSVGELSGSTVTVGIRPEHPELGEEKPNEATTRATTDIRVRPPASGGSTPDATAHGA